MKLIMILSTICLFCSLASADQNTATLPELSTQSFVGTKNFNSRNNNEFLDQCQGLNKKCSNSVSLFVASGDIIYKAGSTTANSDAVSSAPIGSVQNSVDLDSKKIDIKIKNQGLELKLDGMVVCDKNGFKLLPVALKEKIKPDSTVSDAVKQLGPGYINSGSGTGSITWFFADGSILSTSGWPSSVNEKVKLTESKDSPQKSGLTQPTRLNGDSRQLENSWGFNSLYYLFSKDRWDEVPKTDKKILHDSVTVGLDNPRQSILLHNAWSIPMVGSEDDIRLADMKKNIFKQTIIFAREWPIFSMPGYVVAVQKRDGRWALIAEMGEYFFIENDGSVGVSRRAPK